MPHLRQKETWARCRMSSLVHFPLPSFMYMHSELSLFLFLQMADPLMFTVMRDLVILPTSQTVIDRSTIKSHAKDSFCHRRFVKRQCFRLVILKGCLLESVCFLL